MSAHNFDGSRASNGVADSNDSPLHAEPSQPLLDNQQSMLVNRGSDSGDDRAPAAIPMYPYGFEGQGDPLFALEPGEKG